MNGVFPNEDDAFVRAIQAAPLDATLRLVYADWLEAKGDRRSDYLRLEVELVNLRSEDARYQQLRDRQRCLEEQLDPEWRAAVEYKFDVILESYVPACKIYVIKSIREGTGLDLKEAVDIANVLPGIVAVGVSRQDAERIKNLIEVPADPRHRRLLSNRRGAQVTIRLSSEND